jgi:hypothetical protein
MSKRLIDKIKGSPTPKRFVVIPAEEYELLKVAAWEKGKRAEAQRKLKTLNAWKMNNGL